MMENHFQELQSLLKDHDDATAEKLADGVVEPATNYEPEPETIPAVIQQPLVPQVLGGTVDLAFGTGTTHLGKQHRG